jgi:hypothetical protein
VRAYLCRFYVWPSGHAYLEVTFSISPAAGDAQDLTGECFSSCGGQYLHLFFQIGFIFRLGHPLSRVTLIHVIGHTGNMVEMYHL